MGYGPHVVLSGVSFQVDAGDRLCVIGENGSGKSTLVKGLLRLHAPAEGRIEYGSGLRPDRIGYMPQRMTSIADFPAGAFEIVLSGRLASRGLMPFYGRRDKDAAMENMRRLGIEDLKDRCFGELSGGQQQRVLLARALCAAEDLLILDEPVAGLDPGASLDFYDMLGCLNETRKITVIMVSHDLGRAMGRASHILHLNRKQEFFGTRDEYLKSDVCKKFMGGADNV
jgi:zinc transport system ATP-binding protein